MKVFKVLLVVLLCIGCGVLGFFVFRIKKANTELDAQNQALIIQMSNMQTQHQSEVIDTIQVFRYKSNIRSGAYITEDDVEPVQIAAATYTDAFIRTVNDLPAYAAKNLSKDTIVQKADFTYDEYVSDKKFTKELSFTSLPLGLQVGDYVDIRILLPNGESYVVLNHIRVEAIESTSISIKVSEEEVALVTGMIMDQAVYNSYVLFYLERYLDPGADNSIAFYPVCNELAEFYKFNPNIHDLTRIVNPTLRAHMDEVLTLYTTNQNASVSSAFISAMKSQYQAQLSMSQMYVQERKDPETGEVAYDEFLFTKDNSAYDINAFVDKVNDAISGIDKNLQDFEQSIE